MSELRVGIIGAGIIGLTVAVELATHGHEVTLFDAAGPASGTSSAANGAFTPYSDHNSSDAVTALAVESVALYPDYLERLRDLTRMPIDYDAGGVFEVLFEHELDQGRMRFTSMANRGVPVDLLTGDETRAYLPNVSKAAVASVHYRTESRIDTLQLLRASVCAAELLGVVVRAQTPVVGVEPKRNGAEVETSSDSIRFDRVVAATGIGTCRIGDRPIVQIERIRGEIIEVRGKPGLLPHCVYRGDSFITPRRDGRLLLGTSYVSHMAGMDECTETISVGGAIRKLNAAREVFPAVESCEIARVWKSWRPTTNDAVPVVGEYVSEDIVLANGFGGLGLTLAPAAARLIRKHLERQSYDDAYRAFHPDRPGLVFAE